MKTRIQITILTTLTVMIYMTAVGQNNKDKIKGIQKQFQTINQDTTYTTVTLDNEAFLEQMTDGGGQLTGYFKGEDIYKIHEQVGLSYCILTTEYYYWDKQLIFVFEKEDDFIYMDSLATLDYSKTKTSFEGRYYFSNGQLISTKTKGQKRINDSIRFDSQNKSGQLITSGQRNIDLLIKRRK